MEIYHTRCWLNPKIFEYNLTLFLNKYMHFKLYQALFIYKELAAKNDAYFVGAGQKFDFFIQKS